MNVSNVPAISMDAAQPLLADLRALLSQRFPKAVSKALQSVEREAALVSFKTLPTGVQAWDGLTGGIRLGEVTEVCGGTGGAGLVLDSLLGACARAGWLGAWVDAGDNLEVSDWAPDSLERMVWVRCPGSPEGKGRSAQRAVGFELGESTTGPLSDAARVFTALTALKAADLLLRDGNLSWVVLDLQGLSQKELQRVPASAWHRFHRVVEERANVLLVLTPRPMVEGVRVRVVVEEEWGLEALETPRHQLQERALVRVSERGRAPALEEGFRKTA